jgi:hypothetical protein
MVLAAIAGRGELRAVEKSEAPTVPGSKTLDQQLAAYQKVSAVFEAVEPTSVNGKQWVVVTTGPAGWSQAVEGWLMEDGPDRVRILDYDVQWLRKPRPGEQQPKVKEGQGLTFDELRADKYRVAWSVRPGDFAPHRQALLKRGLSEEKQGDEDEGVFGFVNQRSQRVGVILDAARYGHWAVERGEKQVALELFTLAAQAHQKYARTYVGESPAELPQFVANQIAAGYRSGAIMGAHSGTARPECLRQWEIVARIPYHEYIDEAKRMVAGYKALIAEDAAWKEPLPETLNKMSVEQQTDYWLYHLRDANVEQTMSPGMCHVVSPFAGMIAYRRDPKRPDPAEELRELGFAALPKIIVHLDDTRPTRCQGHWRSYAPESYYLLCYGDCCQQIFESITGHSIFDRGYSNGYPIKDGKGKECQARAERWWQEFRRKGEKQMLIEGIEAAGHESDEQARRLVEKYPGAALEPVIRTARRTNSVNLYYIATRLKDDRLVPFLREDLQNPDAHLRLAAAEALMEREKEEGVQAIFKEWKQVTWETVDESREQSSSSILISCMARTGELAAIHALAEGFGKAQGGVRLQIIRACGGVKKDWRGQALSPATQAAIEGLLVRALTDTEEESSARGGPDGKEVRNPTIGDLAAEILVERWNRPQLFDIYGHFGARERQKLGLRNLWLKKCGKVPIPVPPERKVDPLPDEKVRPLLAAVQHAATAEERQASLEALEKLGLPALPAMRRFLQPTKPGPPASGPLGSLARRIALTVEEVRFTDNSARPSQEFRRRAEAYRGKPITDAGLLELIRSMTEDPPQGIRGINVTMERPGDDTGASLIVTLVADRPPRKGLLPQLTTRKTIVVDRTAIMDELGGLAGVGRRPALSEVDWKQFSEKLRSALQSSPEQYLLVRIGCEEMR